VIRGWHLLSDPERSGWASRLAEWFRRTSRLEDNCATWPQSIRQHRPGRTALLVQHCHGAPGIVNCFADFPDHGIDDLLINAGEFIWQSGPLRKGLGLCHGAAGNGFAFLKLFPADERATLARSRPPLRHACHRPASPRYGEIRSEALPALDRRSGPRRLPIELHRRNGSFPNHGQLLRAVTVANYLLRAQHFSYQDISAIKFNST
jgi:Lanthionine synthetase C-like protein